MKNQTINAAIAAVLLAGLMACSPVPTVPTATRIVPTITPAATATIPVVPVAAMDAQRSLKVGDLERTYFLHVPAGLNNQQSVPLMFVFHGYSDNGGSMRSLTGFDRIADEHGFIVVYPDGSGPAGSFSWNAGSCCGYAVQNNVDEPAFVRAIIADVETFVRVDSKRTYATGFSNGALLSYRLGCEMSDTFAAIGPVAGVLAYTPCQPQQPVSLIDVHGMKDQVIPFDGGGSGIQFPSVPESLATWVKLDGCDGKEQMEKDKGVTHTSYGACVPGVSVQLYAIDGLGHSWVPPFVAPISSIIWDFFAAHPKP